MSNMSVNVAGVEWKILLQLHPAHSAPVQSTASLLI